ncbi:sensor histidine kinase [Vagococcus acidifermentans]|uniref:ATP-binding protein n=1 Tax=Vagococcus acidifermentans TaxID=564710 RepID=A0A430AWU9_9ENTE|nr:GHKL domain-containing protein [Vagococcus acidifermentans]RSU12523.1 ATP-binding protein [Vagococcus acidifermentans]
MVIIDTKAYIVRMIGNLVLYYLLIFSLLPAPYSRKKKVMALLFLPVTFVAQLFTGFAEVIPVVASYFILKPKGKSDISLLNVLLLCTLVNFSASLVSSIIMYFSFSHEGVKGYSFVFFHLMLNLLLLAGFVYLYKKLRTQAFIEKYSSKTTAFFMSYLILATLLVSYGAHYFEAFDQFIIGISVFVMLQLVFVLFLFLITTVKQKDKYEQQLKEQELSHLKKYTDKLEQSQERLRKFRHDYKNLLLSLKETVDINADADFADKIQELEVYSDAYLSSTKFDYPHLKNVKNDYLKSLLIAKLYQATESSLHCRFECSQVIEVVPIPIFDCVRVLGIMLDNAIEAASESEAKELSLLIYQDAHQIEFLIENSCQPLNVPINSLLQKGFSTKAGHQGLGLHTIQEINHKHRNMFVQYHSNQLQFTAQVILMREERS